MVTDPLKIVSDMLDAIYAVREALEQAQEEQTYSEQEIIDLEHALELTRFNASEGYRMAVELKDARVRRRKAKNQIEELLPLVTVLNRSQKFISDLKAAHAEIEIIRGQQRNRRYTPRVRTDMVESFNKAKEREYAQ
ncbi:hypothetical protein [Paenibacillus senegalensis]|uniref:hypothetical protein n=1 Tax=Paenibacillus senegalensis TaxID=1465766 RepID=UPI0002887D1E|nr:hypothetical protein [Paenibacillus senegalensis]